MSTDFASRPQLAVVVPSRALSRPAVSAARRVELEQRNVDRSHFKTYPLPRWSVEGQKAEAWLRPIREETTIAERLAAYRRWVKTDAKKSPSRA
jgi:hypothetical protein